jgi:hypothetical protein
VSRSCERESSGESEVVERMRWRREQSDADADVSSEAYRLLREVLS